MNVDEHKQQQKPTTESGVYEHTQHQQTTNIEFEKHRQTTQILKTNKNVRNKHQQTNKYTHTNGKARRLSITRDGAEASLIYISTPLTRLSRKTQTHSARQGART